MKNGSAVRRAILALVTLSIFGMFAIVARGADAPPGEGEAFEQNKRLGRGVNIIGYDPIWKSRDRGRFQAEHFKLIAQARFNHVRINLHPFRDSRPDSRDRITDDYFQTLDWAIEQCLANKLMVIVDFHEFQTMAKDPDANKPRFLGMWEQIATRYKDKPREVVFELLNEPHGKLTAEAWNPLLREALAVVRKTNPTRTVIVGPDKWNGIGQLDKLELPEDDRNLIVTVHYYSPFAFTHQGAPWANLKDKTGVAWNGTEKEREAIDRDFDKAQAWSVKNKRPLYLGEFGVYDKAEMSSRVRWLDYVTRSIEKRGWSWGYWQFDSDFVLYDIKARKWVEPVRDALVPASAKQS